MNETNPPAAEVSLDKDAPAQTVPPTGAKRRGTGWLIWVLLLLLALAAGAGYWGYVQWRQQQQALNALHGEVAALKQNLDAQLAQQQQNSRNELKRLTDDTQAAQQSMQLAMAGVQADIEEHQRQLASLKQMLGQDASHWRLSEIERLLTAAQLRVGALDDPIGARQMLREANRLAGQLGGESLALRTAIQQLSGALDRSAPLDRDGLAAQMFSLAQRMPALPLRAADGRADAAGAAQDQAADDWWSKTKAWFGSWMQIKNTAQPPAPEASPTISAERPSPLTEAARVLLQARASLLSRHVDEAYRLSAQALALAEQAKGLDQSSPQTRQALAELRDIAAALEQGYRPQALDFAPAFVALRSLYSPVGAAAGGADAPAVTAPESHPPEPSTRTQDQPPVQTQEQ
ncbi:MAG: uroporphyrinogen-III C-methyltransferase [Pseudomonadota bacterium]